MVRLLIFWTAISTILFGIAQSVSTSHNVVYAGFTQGATFSIANQLGMFTANGLTVEFQQIPNFTFGYATLLNGGYDILTGTIDDAVNVRFNQNGKLTVLGQLDAGADLVIASAHNITSIEQLKGHHIMVDSAISGYAYMIRKVLSYFGLDLERGDYTFQAVGSTITRFQFLQTGQLPNGTSTQGSLLTYPFTGEASAAALVARGNNPNILARISDFINPVSSSAFTVATSALTNITQRALITRFMASFLVANQFLADPNNQACAIASIAEQLNVTSAVALEEYLAATNPMTGETALAQKGIFDVPIRGLLNVLDVRAQFDGFNTLTTGLNFMDAITPSVGGFIDYSVRDQILRTPSSAMTKFKCRQ